MGIHWTFAPVADVNNNPANPVINIRSYGEDPELVAQLSAAFIRGAHAGRLLTTAKHFPGHGDTAVDSHLALADGGGRPGAARRGRAAPFRARDRRPGSTRSCWATSRCRPSTPRARRPRSRRGGHEQLLRASWASAAWSSPTRSTWRRRQPAWEGEAAVRAVQAGADVVLHAARPAGGGAGAGAGGARGAAPEARLDESVRRVLSPGQGPPGARPPAAGRPARPRREVGRPGGRGPARRGDGARLDHRGAQRGRPAAAARRAPAAPAAPGALERRAQPADPGLPRGRAGGSPDRGRDALRGPRAVAGDGRRARGPVGRFQPRAGLGLRGVRASRARPTWTRPRPRCSAGCRRPVGP